MRARHEYKVAFRGARTAPDTFLRSATKGLVRLVSERGHVTLPNDNRVYGTRTIPPRCIRDAFDHVYREKKRGVISCHSRDIALTHLSLERASGSTSRKLARAYARALSRSSGLTRSEFAYHFAVVVVFVLACNDRRS